jgi:Na+-transporting methylmalonyl-CoA/oxaloacetate decarboxylase gamma subunit
MVQEMLSPVREPNQGWKSQNGASAVVSIAVLMIFMLVFTGISSASGEAIRTEPAIPVSGEDFTLTLNSTGNSIVMISIENETGYVFWSDIISLVDGSATLESLNLAEGNYTINATFWSVNVSTGELYPVFYNENFTVSHPIAAPEKYDAIFVIGVGILVVFSVLAMLALFTYITGRLLPEEKIKPVEISDDAEKIAAIAAVIKIRRG